MKKYLMFILSLLLAAGSSGCMDKASRSVNNSDPVADGSTAHPYRVTTVADLKAVGSGVGGWTLDKCYVQTADIDMTGSGDWNPIGSDSAPFTGIYDGRGYVISNLTLAEVDYQGLFGAIATGAELIDIHLQGVGGDGTPKHMGWLVGNMLDGTVTGCSAEGQNSGYCEYGGGLICQVTAGVVSRCYSAGALYGSIYDLGGLIWKNLGGTVSDCFSTATVNGTSNKYSGGLVAVNAGGISRCYSTGRVRGGDGGDPGATASGLIAVNTGTVTDCYYDTTTSGRSDTGKGEPKTTAEMQTQSTYTNGGWDFTSVWQISSGEYPKLRARY
jgi:hypothetical protein